MSKDKRTVKADPKVAKEVGQDPAFYNDQISENKEPAKTLKKGEG